MGGCNNLSACLFSVTVELIPVKRIIQRVYTEKMSGEYCRQHSLQRPGRVITSLRGLLSTELEG